MSEPKRGNFIAGKNTRKQTGTNMPDFTGRISIPGAEHEHGCALWLGRDRNGKIYISGRVDPTPITHDVMAQLESMVDQPTYDMTDVVEAAANLTVKPHQIIAFSNKFKAPDANDTPEEAKRRSRQPDFWGRMDPGAGSPVVALSIWLDQDRYQRPILRGATSYPEPGRTVEAEIEPTDAFGLPPIRSDDKAEPDDRGR